MDNVGNLECCLVENIELFREKTEKLFLEAYSVVYFILFLKKILTYSVIYICIKFRN